MTLHEHYHLYIKDMDTIDRRVAFKSFRYAVDHTLWRRGLGKKPAGYYLQSGGRAGDRYSVTVSYNHALFNQFSDAELKNF